METKQVSADTWADAKCQIWLKMLNYFSQAYLFSSFSCVFWKFLSCSVKCLPWFNPRFSSPEWRFLFLQETGKLRWGRMWSFQHSPFSFCSQFHSHSSFYRIVMGIWGFISAFCPLSLLWIFSPYLFGCIFTTHFILWQWVAESMVVMWWNLRVDVLGSESVLLSEIAGQTEMMGVWNVQKLITGTVHDVCEIQVLLTVVKLARVQA